MNRKLAYTLVIILLLIIISNNTVFPLYAGSIEPGLKAIENLKRHKQKPRYPFVGVIIEPRKKRLIETVLHFINKLPENTHIQVYHGTENLDYILESPQLHHHITHGKISLWNLGVDNLTIQGYSALLTSKAFWETVQAEKCLIFQTDAITCDQSKVDLQKFMKYDYVGAPIPSHINAGLVLLFASRGYLLDHTRIYNGGLSLRSRSKALEVIKHYPWDQKITEDVWFCVFLPRVGGLLPPKEVAREFSFESEVFGRDNTGKIVTPWGLHKPRQNYSTLCKICPAVKQIPFVPAHTDKTNLYML